MCEQRDTSVPRKHHVDHRQCIETTGVQLKPGTYIECSIALTGVKDLPHDAWNEKSKAIVLHKPSTHTYITYTCIHTG